MEIYRLVWCGIYEVIQAWKDVRERYIKKCSRSSFCRKEYDAEILVKIWILPDFNKTFDRETNQRLLSKLILHRILSKFCKWIRTWLSLGSGEFLLMMGNMDMTASVWGIIWKMREMHYFSMCPLVTKYRWQIVTLPVIFRQWQCGSSKQCTPCTEQWLVQFDGSWCCVLAAPWKS